MDSERNIDIYEYEWVASMIGHIILISVSIFLLYLWYNLLDQVQQDNQWRLYVLLVPIFMYLIFMLPNFIYLYAVPRFIFFKEDIIVIVSPFGKIKMFKYEDISTIIIYHEPKWNEPHKWISSRFRVRLYFFNDKIKVVFNPNKLHDFSALLIRLKEKGIGQVIEWR